MPIGIFTDRVRGGFSAFRTTTSSMVEFVRRLLPDSFSIRHLGPEGLINMKKELVAARPIFRRAGFDLVAVQTELTLSPRLLAYFHLLDDYESGRAETVLEGVRDRRVIYSALSALIRITKWEPVRSEQEMPLQTITIDVSLAPGVHLSFQDPPKPGEEVDLF